MGLGTNAAFLILFTVGIAAGTGLFTAFDEYFSDVRSATQVQSARFFGDVHTNIDITYVVYELGSFQVYVKNTGNIALDPEQAVLFVDDLLLPRQSYTHSMQGKYWEPGEITVFYLNVSSMSKVKVVVEYGVYDIYKLDLMVFAEATSLARLEGGAAGDPVGWYYHAVLYNPTSAPLNVTGLRWWYRSDGIEQDQDRGAVCNDSRYFTRVATYGGSAADGYYEWHYDENTINISVPANRIVVTWIEVNTRSDKNQENTSASYNIEAFSRGVWTSSPFYYTHAGGDKSVHVLFRMDLNLTTDPSNENQTENPWHDLGPKYHAPQYLFNEDRVVPAGSTVRARLIPIVSAKDKTTDLDSALIYITFASGWNYVSGSAAVKYPSSDTVTYQSAYNRLFWNLSRDVENYRDNQTMYQNYLEFNVTAPSFVGISSFDINADVTSSERLTTWERQKIYVAAR